MVNMLPQDTAVSLAAKMTLLRGREEGHRGRGDGAMGMLCIRGGSAAQPPWSFRRGRPG